MSPQAFNRLNLAIAGVLTLSSLTGCASDPAPTKPIAKSTAPLSQPAPSPAPAAALAPDTDSARLQAANVDAYARDLEAALARRAATRPANPALSPATPSSSTPPPISITTPSTPPLPELTFLEQDIKLFLDRPQQRDERTVRPLNWTGLLEHGDAAANQPMSVSAVAPANPATRPAGAGASPDDHHSLPPSLRPQTPAAPDPASIATTDALAARLASQLRTEPRNPIVHLEHQLLQMLLGRPVPQMDSIASLSADDREVIAALMDALANFRTTLRSDEDLLIGRKTRPLLDLADRLRATAGLRIPAIHLCTDVRRFGDYDTFDRAFTPNRRHEVIVYCDVENFESRANSAGVWETSLTRELAIYNEAGQRVSEEKRQPVKDTSRTRRHDFFIASKSFIPALPPGHYYLKVTVTDTLSQRQTQQTLPFQIK